MDAEEQAEFDEIMSREVNQSPDTNFPSANEGGYLHLMTRRANHEKRDFNIKLLGALLSEYRTRSRIRKSYLLLFGYLAYVGVYLTILRLQSNPRGSFKVLEGVRESLLPHEDNGDLQKRFTSVDQVQEWLLEKVDSFWEPSQCGDSMCTYPMEYASWGSHGCEADCGALPSTPVHVHISTYSSRSETEEMSEEDDVERILWNVCSVAEYDGASVCWFDPWFPLASRSQLTYSLELPDADWLLQVIKPSYISVSVVIYHNELGSMLGSMNPEPVFQGKRRRRLQTRQSLNRLTSWPAPRHAPLKNTTHGSREPLSARRSGLEEAQQSFATAETCQALVLELVAEYPNHYLECGGGDMTELCCQRYQ
eukprot:gene9049-10723_t